MTIEIVARERIGARDVARLLGRTQGDAEAILVIAQYLSPQTRSRLVEGGASYGDLTGNWRLSLTEPAVFIQTEGASKDPSPPVRTLRSLKGPAAGRVVRALCDFEPPYGVRELARRAGIPLGTLSRVAALLEEDALIERAPRGPITSVEWRRLITRWVEDYALLESNDSTSWLAPRGLPAVLQKLADAKGIALTGSFAGNEIIKTAPARLLTLYSTDSQGLVRDLDLRSAEVGANVILLEPYDDVVFERTWTANRLPAVHPSQLAADLLTSPGRGPSEAEPLLDWMEANEDAWRS